MSLVLSRNNYLRNHLPRLRHIDPESSPHWEKYYLPKTLRSPKLYGWYHNSPYAQWNNFSHFALNERTLTHTVAQQIFKTPHLSRFSEIMRLAESSVLVEISSQGPFTIFAPSNVAIENLLHQKTSQKLHRPETFATHHTKRKIEKGSNYRQDKNLDGWERFLAEIKADPRRLNKFLRRHICRGNRKIRAVRSGGDVRNLEGEKLEFALKTVDAMGGVGTAVPTLKYWVEGVEVGDYDFRCSNGFLHVIEGILGEKTVGRM